jgi:hypothetical protein
MANLPTFNNADELRERGFVMRDPPVNILAYDPAGDGRDNDALLIVSREEHRRGELWDPDLAVEFIFRILAAHRMPPGLEFPDKLARILRLNSFMAKWTHHKRAHGHIICVEANGVGWGMASSLKSKVNVPVIPYVTVARADEKTYVEGKVSMPRLAALDHLRIQLELHRVKAAKDAQGIKDLGQELNSFVWVRKGRPEAIAGQTDDLVMALAGAVWIGTKLLPPVTKQQKIGNRTPTHGTRSGSMRVQ